VQKHDIAVLSVNPLKTIVGQGYTMQTNVTVTNQGDFTETFNVTLYAKTTTIETKQVTLISGASTIITFTWNTTGFAKGNYTIWAYAWPVQGETDTNDNTLVNTTITIAIVIPGDVNTDGIVETKDIAAICRAYNKKPSDPNWNPNLDINNDNIIETKDIAIACRNYGKTDP
jgi:hypothetical protein